MKTNWYELTSSIGQDSQYVSRAFEIILGDEWIEDTVECAIEYGLGGELAMNCLRHIHSEKACIYAYNVYKSSTGERARMAVWLIKHLTNKISYSWVEDFLNDKNVMDWGLGVLDQLLWGEVIQYDENVERLLELAHTNSNGGLDELIQFIRDYLKDRNYE